MHHLNCEILMTKENYELITRQRVDLIKAYQKIAPLCHSQKEAWLRIAKEPAPRYYISPQQAWEKLRRMVVGDFSTVDNMRPVKQRLYYSLYNKLMEMSQRKEYVGRSLWFICQFLVNEPAPEFFTTPKNIAYIFYRYKAYGKDYRDIELRKEKHKHEVSD